MIIIYAVYALVPVFEMKDYVIDEEIKTLFRNELKAGGRKICEASDNCESLT
jgi:hypothetical protein